MFNENDGHFFKSLDAYGDVTKKLKTFFFVMKGFHVLKREQAVVNEGADI
jgi:hypothetical protein